MKNKIILFGCASQSVKTVKRILDKSNDFDLLGFLDNDKTKWNKEFYSYKVFGGLELLPNFIDKNTLFCNMVTRSTEVRYEITKALVDAGAKLTNLIDPSVDMDFVDCGIGIWIQENIVVQAGVKLGDNVSIHLGSLVSHDCIIGHSSFISVGCHIGGAVEMGDGVFVGVGASILPKIKIGKWSIIGAGALIIKDVPDYSIVVGNPTRILGNTRMKYTDGNVL